MVFLSRLFCVAVLIFLPAGAIAQGTDAVVRALLKLEAKTETGISLREYSEAVADAKLELKLAEGSPRVKRALQEIVELHSSAVDLWQSATGRYKEPFLNGKGAAAYLELYPGAGKALEKGGASMGDFGLHKEALLPFIWQDSLTRLARARELIASERASAPEPAAKRREGGVRQQR